MKTARYIIMIGFVCGLLTVACNKDYAVTGDSTTRSAALNDPIENDSTSGGGISITINEEWKGDTMIHF